MNIYEIECCGETFLIKLTATTYANNKRLAVQAYTFPDGEPFAKITVNIDCPLSNDKTITAFIDTNNCEIFKIRKFLQENEIAKPTGYYGKSGYCTYPEYIFDLSKF